MKPQMNLNELAKEISKHEGLKKETDIAQIKEVLFVLCRLLANPTTGLQVAAALLKRASHLV